MSVILKDVHMQKPFLKEKYNKLNKNACEL